MKTTVDKIKSDEVDSTRVLALKKQIRTLESERKKLHERIGNQEEFAELCSSAVVSAEPFPRFKYTKFVKNATPIVAVLNLSDWHIGEKVNQREVEGFNKFDWDIAQARIFGIVQDFLRWVEVQRSAYTISECHICGLGDYVSGDIHGELLATNEFPLPEQSAKAGTLLGEVIRQIAGHFTTVVFNGVGADNHGRLTRKPQAKQKSSNNMSFVVHAIASAMIERHNNVRMNIAEGMKLRVEINKFAFLFEHGDTIKGQMGIPYYGFARLIGKEAIRRMNSPSHAFHYHNIGHFHVPAIIDGKTLVNGSLSGTTEFDHSAGRHAKPSQIAYFVHPKYGIFNFTAFQGKE